MMKIKRISIDAPIFDAVDLEWKLHATFDAVGAPPHSHVVSLSQILASDMTEGGIVETCTRAALVAAGSYLIGKLTGQSSATDFYEKRDLDDLTDQERTALMGDQA